MEHCTVFDSTLNYLELTLEFVHVYLILQVYVDVHAFLFERHIWMSRPRVSLGVVSQVPSASSLLRKSFALASPGVLVRLPGEPQGIYLHLPNNGIISTYHQHLDCFST